MKSLLIVFLAILGSKTVSQNIYYKETFGNDYKNALKLLKENDLLFNQYAITYDIDEKFLKAIIFPELIRYNSVYDAIEITSLKFLYIKKGSDYNDFSVGYFQMKPSFAERIEKDAYALLDKSFLKKIDFDNFIKTSSSETEREQRLVRITNMESQIKYLIVFYELCELKFKNQNFKTVTDKLKLYATAYNSGYYKSTSNLNKERLNNSFYLGKISRSHKYNYANISAYYYESN